MWGKGMEKSDILKLFFGRMKCTNCEHVFKEEDVTIMREEYGYIVVKLHCSRCDKNIGMAIMGVDKLQMQKAIEMKKTEQEEFSSFAPINYDDVLNAHDFFQELGDDWLKFIPEKYKN